MYSWISEWFSLMSSSTRDQRVQDWEQLIQDHSGMLDRIDPICFSGPVF